MAKSIIPMLTSLLYMNAHVTDLFREKIHSLTRYNKSFGDMKGDRKYLFNRYDKLNAECATIIERLSADTWKATKKGKYYEDLQAEHNYIARLLMYYFDRFCQSQKACSELEHFMMTHGESQGFFEESDYDVFRLKEYHNDGK